MEKEPNNIRTRQLHNKVHHTKEKVYKQKKKPLFDLYYIVKYFILWVVFSLICFGVKTVVMTAIKLSPTHQAGNGMIQLYEVHNTGAAFNLFAGHPEGLISLSFLAIIIITAVVLLCSGRLTQAAISAMAFLSAGITMNMLERIRYGYVIDYIHCNFLHNFPVFNLPDLMIVVGAICLVLSVLLQRR